MTNQTSGPPIVPEQAFNGLVALFALLADPEKYKQRLAELSAHQATLTALIDVLNEARAEHERARAAVFTAETASKDRVVAERAAHVEACKERECQLDAREAQIARTESATKAESEKVKLKEADLERRLGVVRGAAAAAAA
jgi:chromosome segregation ATPase